MKYISEITYFVSTLSEISRVVRYNVAYAL